MFDRNHYIQNRLLKNFATKSDNGKYKICVLDLINFAVNYRNTESAFYEKNIICLLIFNRWLLQIKKRKFYFRCSIACVNLQDTIGRFCLNLSKTEKLQTFADETLG